MAQGKKPVGALLAIVKTDRGDKFLELGPVWLAESGALSFTLDVEPNAWRANPGDRRAMVIRFREGFTAKATTPAPEHSEGQRVGDDGIPF